MQPVSAPTEDGRRNQFDLFLVGRNYGWQEVGYCSLINTEVFDNVEKLMCEGKKVTGGEGHKDKVNTNIKGIF